MNKTFLTIYSCRTIATRLAKQVQALLTPPEKRVPTIEGFGTWTNVSRRRN